MKRYPFIKFAFTIFLFVVSLLSFYSCEKTEEAEGEPYFTIEGDPTGLATTADSKTQTYTVRSNRPWKIVAQSTDSWVKPFPDEGDDDGTFKMIVDKNTSFESRIMNFAFVVDGTEQPVLFRVEQAANVPYITIKESSGLIIPAAGGDGVINITSNVNWNYSIENSSWLTVKSQTASQVTLTAAVNNGLKRSVVMTVTSADFPSLSQTVTITQSPGSVVFEEDFSWLAYGSAIPYTTTGETRIDAWKAEETARGWTGTVNTVTGSGTTPLCYARQGFVKLGKTNYGGDIISPKLSGIEGTKTVKVTFKAAGYITAAGTKDDNLLKVYALNAGTATAESFTIDFPDLTGVIDETWHPTKEYSFTITGATSQTQIKFLGSDYDLTTLGAKKNRIFLDDIKVEILP